MIRGYRTFTPIFAAISELNKAATTKKIQAVLPAEILRFVVQFRQSIISSCSTSDAIATLLIMAKKKLEKMTPEKRGVLIEQTMVLRRKSMESWKIQSVLPDDVYLYADKMSNTFGLKLSATIAILTMIGAQEVSTYAVYTMKSEPYWLDIRANIRIEKDIPTELEELYEMKETLDDLREPRKPKKKR